MNKKFMKGMAALCICAAFTSCSHDADFEPADEFELAKNEYSANFIKKYGEIDPNQSWDFTTMQPVADLGSDESSASTRAITRAYTSTQGSMEIEQEVISWVKENLQAGKNNFLKGSPFTVDVPNNPSEDNAFTIVPIFQGQAGYYWQLYMKEGNRHHLLWSKGDIEYKTSKEGNWISPGTAGEGMKNVFRVKSPTFTITGLPALTKLEFYLKVWDDVADFNDYQRGKLTVWKNGRLHSVAPRYMSSLQKQMIALEDARKPAAVSSDYDVTIIGCEDAEVTTDGSDRDYEDLVLMVYGNPGPPINHVDKVREAVTKRYMIEDLGATNDFDFNDVVVDVSEVVWYQTKYNAFGRLVSKTELSRSQEAIIRAMGGTRDFTLTIGDTPWTKSTKYDKTQMLNTGWNNTPINANDELVRFTVTGWKPEKNNISISVERQGDSEGYYTIAFPKEGTVPMIIAIDADPLYMWKPEKVSIDKSWYTE